VSKSKHRTEEFIVLLSIKYIDAYF